MRFGGIIFKKWRSPEEWADAAREAGYSAVYFPVDYTAADRVIDGYRDAARAADLVICRAGASTISEITALAVPTIIVPSPYVANNHQEKNARILAQHGGACLIREEESSGGKLYRTARDILDSPTRRESMSRGMAELGILDATERIYQTVMELVR